LNWLAYDRVEPFGEDRADLRSAIIAQSVVNVLIQANSAKRRPQLTKLADYLAGELMTQTPRQRQPLTIDRWKQIKRGLMGKKALTNAS
jgi:hypothetical protein